MSRSEVVGEPSVSAQPVVERVPVMVLTGYLGAGNLSQLREKARYIRVSPAGQREAAPHDVVELKTGN